MKTILNPHYATTQVDVALLIIRLGIGAMMLVHGFPKLQLLLAGGEVQFPSVMGMSPAVSLGLAVFAEFLCSILLIIGLGTRLATIPLIVTMMTAVFIVHANDSFSNQELGLHYLLSYVVLLILGGGKFSFDTIVLKSEDKRQPVFSGK